MQKGYVGAAAVKIAPYASNSDFFSRAFVDVGNVTKINYAFTEQKVTLPDGKSISGGNDSSMSRISEASMTFDLRHFTPDNFAMAFWGISTAETASAITNEPHVAHLGKFIPSKRLIDRTVAFVLKVGATTIADTEYTVSAAGITLNATPSGVLEDDTLLFSYTPKAGHSIQTLVTSAPEVSILIEGVNAVDGLECADRFYRCKVGVGQGFDRIGQDYATLPITVEILKDETIVGTGKSQFFVIDQED